MRVVFQYERLTKQQAIYLPLMFRPDAPDVFVRSRTGSGKTLAFLLPAVEAIVGMSTQKSTIASRSRSSTKTHVQVLILSPTRELAVQTAGEATRLLTFHTGLHAAAITGGTDRGKDLRLVRSSAPAILVATPGRLMDLINEEKRLLSHVRVVVLDEADRLLDPGFVKNVREILATMPPSTTRRTFLFTATVPPEVLAVARKFMRTGFEYVDASGVSRTANPGVTQRAVVCNPAHIHIELAKTLYAHHQARREKAKTLVFFGSIAYAELYTKLFKNHTDPAWETLLELHGGLAQNKRTRAMEDFKRNPGGVLFASDAAGRGIDIADVSMVVQIGCAPPDVYQQRVGRTGRAGARGDSVLLLGVDEIRILGPITKISPNIQVQNAAPPLRAEEESFKISDRDQTHAARAFKGYLGAFKPFAKVLGMTPQEVVDAVAARLMGIGLKQIPIISAQTLNKMGLNGVSFDTDAIVKRLKAH